MGSDQGNKMCDATGFRPSEPKLCVNNGCSFFGMAATMDLCSKCYKDSRMKKEQAACEAAMETLLNKFQTLTADGNLVQPSVDSVTKKRCLSCKKKVGVAGGFRCRCGETFCGAHRYPEEHDCTFDFKAAGREALARANPVVRADKVERF